MSYHHEEKNINGLLDKLASALNTADTDSIPNFFTDNGKFMPEGNQTINHPSSLASGAKQRLSPNAFQIQYSQSDIQIEGDFAFGTATAHTSQLESDSPLAVTRTSRDFFVFKKIGSDWKIHRYIFNNVS